MEPLPLSQVSLECVQESSGTTWSGCACLLERKSRAAVASARAWVPYLPISWVSFCCEVVLIANSGCLPRTNTQLQVPPRRSTNPAERVAWRMMRDCPAVAQQPWWTSRRYKYGFPSEIFGLRYRNHSDCDSLPLDGPVAIRDGSLAWQFVGRLGVMLIICAIVGWWPVGEKQRVLCFGFHEKMEWWIWFNFCFALTPFLKFVRHRVTNYRLFLFHMCFHRFQPRTDIQRATPVTQTCVRNQTHHELVWLLVIPQCRAFWLLRTDRSAAHIHFKTELAIGEKIYAINRLESYLRNQLCGTNVLFSNRFQT